MSKTKKVKNNAKTQSAEDKALDKFAEMMIGKLEGLQSDWHKPWFTEGALSWPKNLSGREYNGMNALMLMMHCEQQGYELPLWATFDRVDSLNGQRDPKTKKFIKAKDKDGNDLPRVAVNKGEKSFPVFITVFTVIHSETKEKIKYDDYVRLSEEERKAYIVYPRLQVYNVFNIAQTNIKEARPDYYEKLQEQYGTKKKEVQSEDGMFTFDAMDYIITNNKWICPIKPAYGDEAYYSISRKCIVVPEKRQFKSGESFYSNLFHEMAHSTGAEEHLNRLKPTSFGSKDYAREELVAEMTAALTSQRYGISKTVKEDSLPYLKSWLDNLKEDATFIKSCLLDVKKATSMLTQCIDKVSAEMTDVKVA